MWCLRTVSGICGVPTGSRTPKCSAADVALDAGKESVKVTRKPLFQTKPTWVIHFEKREVSNSHNYKHPHRPHSVLGSS